jgi:hypothetical protein
VALEAVEEGFLAAKDFFAGGGEVEPGAAVGFGDFDLAAGARGPFDEAGVGDEGGGVEVAFDGPRGDLFAAGLSDDAEGEEFTQVRREGGAGFFLKFAAGGSSSGRYSPLGMDQASFLAQKGPPGWMRKTSRLGTRVGESRAGVRR